MEQRGNLLTETLRQFGMAVLFVLAALGPEYFIVKHFFPYPFLFLFLGAVVASAWFGGMLAGSFAVLMSIVAVDYFFIPPVRSFTLSAAVIAYLATFVLCALVASWLSSWKKKSEESLKEARDQLELRVTERTAALMKAQAELTHLSRVLSMGELTASIAHEVKQPLTAIVTNGHASLEWLSANPPNLERARQTTKKIIEDGTRAGVVLSRIRALFNKEPPAKDWLDINELIEELIVIVRAEARGRRISINMELAEELPLIKADRVQIQQVLLNLVMNSMDAMSDRTGGRNEVIIRSVMTSPEEVGVQVEDFGGGLDPAMTEKIFDPFFTTKPQGLGVGLSVSRSIIESHEGRIWGEPSKDGGTVFQFTIPTARA